MIERPIGDDRPPTVPEAIGELRRFARALDDVRPMLLRNLALQGLVCGVCFLLAWMLAEEMPGATLPWLNAFGIVTNGSAGAWGLWRIGRDLAEWNGARAHAADLIARFQSLYRNEVRENAINTRDTPSDRNGVVQSDENRL